MDGCNLFHERPGLIYGHHLGQSSSAARVEDNDWVFQIDGRVEASGDT